MSERSESLRAAALRREAIEANGAMLLAGLRRRPGKDGDLLVERRRTCETWAEVHAETMRRMVARPNEALTNHG